jgi:hypothetical protein
LFSIAKGQSHDIHDWRELGNRFQVTVTQDIQIARNLFCSSVHPHNPFPLDLKTTRKPASAITMAAAVFTLSLPEPAMIPLSSETARCWEIMQGLAAA